MECEGEQLYNAECDSCGRFLGRWVDEYKADKVVEDHKNGKFYFKCG